MEVTLVWFTVHVSYASLSPSIPTSSFPPSSLLPLFQVSDDEDDTHPNIDTASLFRWRHQARVERMEKDKEEKEALVKESAE